MARKLKTYQASVGFFDLAIAAPSMKAALQAWGADRNLFHEGMAKESDDPDVIAATMAAPGLVLRRPVGTRESFKEHAGLPTYLARGGSEQAGPNPAPPKKPPKKKPAPRARDAAAERKAARAFEQEQKRRELDRARQEAAAQKERERRQRAVEKAQAALDAARERHEKNAAEIDAEREALEKRSQAEDARWEKERSRLEAALRRAQG
jgi:hypothetical protein